ncbi:MAG: hypothetical protein PHE32_04170 [Candidatus Shapirobacteria bacterium]|nr:hypothetical protein [Candidatus Shapirobacteria bacterium]
MELNQRKHVVIDERLKYPIFVITYNRANGLALTIKHLVNFGCKFNVIVHEEQVEAYKRDYPSELINWIIFDPKYKENYEVLSTLSWQEKNAGSGAERNFAWDCSKQAGYDSHWLMDDNIEMFSMPVSGGVRSVKRVKCPTNEWWKRMEQAETFFNTYSNLFILEIGETGNCVGNAKPILNRRCFSCLLIYNHRPTQWRGRYNEDVILSLDTLVNGFCTVQIFFLTKKKQLTFKAKGGNHDLKKGEKNTDTKNSLYSDGSSYKLSSKAKSELLICVYPKFTELTWKYGRIHHKYKNFDLFKQKLIMAQHFGQKIKVNEQKWVVSHRLYNEKI